MDALIPESPAGWWALVGIGLLILELVIPGVFLIWIGIAALAVAGSLLVIDIPFAGQAIAFVVLSLASLWAGTKIYRRGDAAPQGALRQADAFMVGRGGCVVEALRHGRGKVKVGDSLWLAEGPDLDAGAAIRVIGQKGTILQVVPAEA